MSGLLERIVRRRRASASSRLGPPAENGNQYGVPSANGGSPPAPAPHLNGTASPDRNAQLPHTVPSEQHDEPPTTELAALSPVEASPAPELFDEPAPIEPARVGPAPVEPALPEPTSDEPPASEPSDPDHEPDQTSPQPPFRERGRMRRRARYLRRLREVQLRDIGGFMLELHRFQRVRPDLVEIKVNAAANTDTELKSLERALGEQQTLRELREPGIGGACGQCGAVHGSEDRFCATCGAPLSGGDRALEPPSELEDESLMDGP